MPIADQTRLVRQAVALMRNASYAIAVTGAGISTPSGIPDFRSVGSGLWELVDPYEVASISAFLRRPESFFDWIRPLAKTLLQARPNAAHRALAELEARFYLRALITQNIDGLHHRAGHRRVLEMHGHLREVTCVRCLAVSPSAAALEQLLAGGIPRCTICGGVLKPNVILFDEPLPASILADAQREARRCDLCLVAGSSLEVAPAGDIPLIAHRMGAKLILVNLSPTHIDHLADVVIRADVTEVLPQLVEGLFDV